MPRPLRPQIAGGHYRVIARGVAGAPIVMDDGDRSTFVRLLSVVERQRQWRVHAYCLMTTHVHLVVETPQPNLSSGLQRVLGIHAQTFNERWGRFGHLFADRFTSRLITDDDYFAEVCRYVLDNPVRAGLCSRAADWRWSGGLLFRALNAPEQAEARGHVRGLTPGMSP